MLKRIALVLLSSMVLIGMMASVSMAADAHYNPVRVDQVGCASNGDTFIRLSDLKNTPPDFTEKLFMCSSTAANSEALATALTAYSLGMNVYMFGDAAVSPGRIKTIMIVSP